MSGRAFDRLDILSREADLLTKRRQARVTAKRGCNLRVAQMNSDTLYAETPHAIERFERPIVLAEARKNQRLLVWVPGGRGQSRSVFATADSRVEIAEKPSSLRILQRIGRIREQLNGLGAVPLAKQGPSQAHASASASGR